MQIKVHWARQRAQGTVSANRWCPELLLLLLNSLSETQGLYLGPVHLSHLSAHWSFMEM